MRQATVFLSGVINLLTRGSRCQMKIGILTFHRAVNFGAALQAYALCTTLRKNSTCEIIDYRNRAVEIGSLKGHMGLKAKLKLRIGNVLSILIYRKRKKRFRAFLADAVSETIYHNKNQLRAARSEYGAFITGSDQVWNPRLTDYDDVYMLSFCDDKKKKYSYAASTGSSTDMDNIPPAQLSLLGDFSGVSLREQTLAARFGEKIGAPVLSHPDPVFLMKQSEWSEIAVAPQQKNYVLYYALFGSDRLLSYARQAAEALDAELVAIPTGYKRKAGITYLSDAGPREFIGLIENARHVVTNSFHGMALSVIFCKPLTIEYHTSARNSNDRFDSLVDMFELQNHILTDMYTPAFSSPVNSETVNRVLSARREEALSYLNGICEAARETR